MSTEFKSVAEVFMFRCSATPDGNAFARPEGAGFKWSTWKETAEDVRAVACGLRALGIETEQRVGLLSGTRLEWIIADLGIIMAGAACTTVYPSSKGDECAYILTDSHSRLLIAEDDKQVAKIMAVREQIPSLTKIIVIDGKADHDGFVITLDDLKKLGREHDAKDPAAYERIAKELKAETLCTLIYTSGTTGTPKGVELTHSNWVYEGRGIDALGLISPDDVQYFWLPLSHSFGKVMLMAQLRVGFATAVDGRIDMIIPNLAIVKPTFMCAVPRIFEKVYNKVITGAKEGGGIKWSIFQWATEVGKEASRVKQKGETPGGLLAIKYAIATKLVFSKLQERFGGRLKFFVSGSAPLSREMAEFFHAAGLLICEGYGLTETSAASFVNTPKRYKFGTVGPALPETELFIAPEDGEIFIRGPGVMRAYHNKPEATAEVFVKGEGWFATGDIGELDPDGFLRITDRKKDLIKTSGGKYVAPQSIEGKMKAICPLVSQIVVHGDNRNFCSALVALDPEAMKKWATDNGMGDKSYEQVVADPKVKTMLQPYFDQLNKQLASYESIKMYAVLPRDLTLDDGDLTASLKLKRKVVEKKFKDILDGFYAGAMEK